MGTLGGGIVTQFYAIRGKRIDAQLQRDHRAEERLALAHKETIDEKRAAYAALNASAHYFRTTARRYLAEKDSANAAPEKFATAWEALRDSYARAQMVLSDRALDIASEVNRCIEEGHQAALDIETNETEQVAALDHYLDDTLGFAVRLLRRALREDLGIQPPSDVDLDERLEMLEGMRRRQFGRRGYRDTQEHP
ncbi:hypothetical protein ACQPZ2_26770 [Nocardia pseudovaccinii]|uniref:hypothetical protein n=1 Tax=Nocardia pseudovaccinii TaxID=189540 RepID=UPI003D9453D7